MTPTNQSPADWVRKAVADLKQADGRYHNGYRAGLRDGRWNGALWMLFACVVLYGLIRLYAPGVLP